MGTVDQLSRMGISVWLIGDKVKAFPKPLITNAVREMIADDRAAIVDELLKVEAGMPRPYFHRGGGLVIPFNSPRRYHWWAGGQSVAETIREISALQMEAQMKAGEYQ